MLESHLATFQHFINFQVEACISPGLTIITWNALNIDQYIDIVHRELEATGFLIKKVF